MKLRTAAIGAVLTFLGIWGAARLQLFSIGGDAQSSAVAVPSLPDSNGVLDPTGVEPARLSVDTPENAGRSDEGAAAVAEPEPQVGAPGAGEDGTEDEMWSAEFAGLSTMELQAAADALNSKIQLMESDAASDLHDRGQYEVVSSGKIKPAELSNKEVTVFQMGTGSELHRVVLPEFEFPELYALKRKLGWMRAHAAALSISDQK